MKTLILYASKYGCTTDCVNYLKEKLQGEVTTENLKHLKTVDVQRFDWIVIGGPIYMGKLHKATKRFCEGMQALQGQKIALFLCCTTPEQADGFFRSNFPPALLARAVETANFGGELRLDKMGFIDKRITALAARLEPRHTEILYKNIDRLAGLINKTLK